MSASRRSSLSVGVDDVQDQVGEDGLLERRLERLDQLVGQLLDEADGVGQQEVAAGELEGAGGRVEGVEEPVPHPDLGPGQRVEQGRLAGVGVAGERDARQRGALPAGPHHAAVALQPREAAAQRGDPVARQAAVGLDLRLAGPVCRFRSRRRVARGASTAPACAPCCIRAVPARPAACPRPSGRGRRRCRGSPPCGRSPARPARPRGCAPGAAPARRRRRRRWRRWPRPAPSAPPACRGRSSGRDRAPSAAAASRPRSPPRRCAAAPSARPAGRRPRSPSMIPIASARWRARGFETPAPFPP